MKNQFLEDVKQIYNAMLSENPWGTIPLEDEIENPEYVDLIKKAIAPTDFKTFGRTWRTMLMDANVNPVEFVETFDIKSAEDFVKKFKVISQNY